MGAQLNGPQREAVEYGDGPLVVFAGAGSGKTRVITHRVAHLVRRGGLEPWRVLAVTFTNRAAQEMRERAEHLMGDHARALWLGTFHATCARLLRAHAGEVGIAKDFAIYDDADQKALVTRVVRDMELDERRFVPKVLAAKINQAKQEVLQPEDLPRGDMFEGVVADVYLAYEKALARANGLDFGDLIFRLVVALESDERLLHRVRSRFGHVLVDEFQDTNHAQWRLVNALCKDHRCLCVVGDDDQSIYRWRGADRRNILDFRQHYPEAHLVKLEQNYRSTKRVLRLAHAIISRNYDREPKRLWTDNDEGERAVVMACDDERDEARVLVAGVREAAQAGVPHREMVAFYRTHAQSRVLEEGLRAANIPYRVVGGMRFYDRAEVKDVLAYLRVIHHPHDDVSLLRIINTPARGVGKTTLERLASQAGPMGRSLWAALTDATVMSSFGAGPQKKLRAFVEMVEDLRQYHRDHGTLSDVVNETLDRSTYLPWLKSQDSVDAESRIQNLQELVGSVLDFEAEAEDPTLSQFLELVTLQTSADQNDAPEDSVTLMTIHAAKGLEFDVVYVTGLEERLFPRITDDPFSEDPDELEEERRLAYVAFTRARQALVLTYACMRRLYGQTRVSGPSRFLCELPEEDVHRVGDDGGPGARRGLGMRARPVNDVELPGHVVAPGETSAESLPKDDNRGRGTESYVDYTDGDLVVERGMRVRHQKFGVGTVSDFSEGSPPRVTVDFPGWGRKRMVASFLMPA